MQRGRPTDRPQRRRKGGRWLGGRRLSKNLTAEDLKTVPKGAIIKYQCQMDNAVWYEPVEQVLTGVPLFPKDPSEAQYCPYCDEPAWPVGFFSDHRIPQHLATTFTRRA